MIKKHKPYCILYISDFIGSIGAEHYYGVIEILDNPGVSIDKAECYGSMPSRKKCINMQRKMNEEEYYEILVKDHAAKHWLYMPWEHVIDVGYNLTDRFNNISQLIECALKVYKKEGLDKTHGFISLYHGQKHKGQVKIKCPNNRRRDK
jgi:hypothetical protein